jgi:hypothetical protein
MSTTPHADADPLAVLDGRTPWAMVEADCLGFLGGLPPDSIDLLMSSPPYCDARTYGRSDVSRDCGAWVEWNLRASELAVRACRGLVLWVCAGVTCKGCF